MRSALAILLAVAVAGMAALLVAGATDRRDVIAETGLPATRSAAQLAPGQQVCRGIDVTAPFNRVRVVADRPAPQLEVTVGAARGNAIGTTIPVGTQRVARAAVCIRNAGGGPVTLYGAPPDVPPNRIADPGLKALPAIVLLRPRPVSTLSQLPTLLRRAALFKAGWLHAAVFWVLLVLIAAGLPALLAGALRAAYAASECSSSRDAPSS
jgi:hypothetical protein